MKEHSENYRFYLDLTRENFRVNTKKYEQFLNAKQFLEVKKPKRPLGIKKTVLP